MSKLRISLGVKLGLGLGLLLSLFVIAVAVSILESRAVGDHLQLIDDVQDPKRVTRYEMEANMEAIGLGVMEFLRTSDSEMRPVVTKNQGDIEWLEEYFSDHVFPVLAPVIVDDSHPFPALPNLSIALVLSLKQHQKAREKSGQRQSGYAPPCRPD